MGAQFLLTAAAVLAPRDVLVLRHCVRAPYASLRNRGAAGFDSADNYSARPFPPIPKGWGTAAQARCTPRGRALAARLGASLAAVLPRPASVRADNFSTRCVTTAGDVAAGLDAAVGAGAGALLDPVAAGVCRALTGAELGAAVRAQLAAAQDPASYLHPAWAAAPARLAELQRLVGAGAAPPLPDIADYVSDDGWYGGGLFAASEALVATFVLEAGAGLPVAWGALDGAAGRAALYHAWLPQHVLYARINHGGARTATRLGGAVLWHIVGRLAAGGGAAASEVLVGHDTTLDALAGLLGLRWRCGGFAADAAPPLSGLLFRRDGGAVVVRAVCTDFDGAAAGDAVFGDATMLRHNASGGVPFDEFRDAAMRAVDFSCVLNGTVA